jgi:hypothetical protein
MKIYKSIIEPVDTSVLWFNPKYGNNLMWYSPKGWTPINRNEEQDEDIEDIIKKITSLKDTQDLYTKYYTLNSKSKPNGIRIYKPDGNGGKEDFLRYYRKSSGQNRLEINPFMTFETDSSFDYLNTLHIGDSNTEVAPGITDKIGLDIERGKKVYLRSGTANNPNWRFEMFVSPDDGIKLETYSYINSPYGGSKIWNKIANFKLGGDNSEESILIEGKDDCQIKATKTGFKLSSGTVEVLNHYYDANVGKKALELKSNKSNIRLMDYDNGDTEAYFDCRYTHVIHYTYTDNDNKEHVLFKIPQSSGFEDTGAIPKWYVNSRVFGGITITKEEFNALINGTQETISYVGKIMSHDVKNYPAPNMPLSMTITVKDSSNKKTKYTLYRETVTDTTSTYYSRVLNEGTQGTKSIIECSITNGEDQTKYSVVIKLLSIKNDEENVKNIIFSDFYLEGFNINGIESSIFYKLFEIVSSNTPDNDESSLFGAIWVRLTKFGHLLPLYLTSKVDYSGDYDYSYILSSPIGNYFIDRAYKYGFYTVSYLVNGNYNGIDFHQITIS